MSNPSSAAQARARVSPPKAVPAKARAATITPPAPGYEILPTQEERSSIEGWAAACGTTPDALVAEGFHQFAAKVAAKFGEYRRRRAGFDAETVADIERSLAG